MFTLYRDREERPRDTYLKSRDPSTTSPDITTRSLARVIVQYHIRSRRPVSGHSTVPLCFADPGENPTKKKGKKERRISKVHELTTSYRTRDFTRTVHSEIISKWEENVILFFFFSSTSLQKCWYSVYFLSTITRDLGDMGTWVAERRGTTWI